MPTDWPMTGSGCGSCDYAHGIEQLDLCSDCIPQGIQLFRKNASVTRKSHRLLLVRCDFRNAIFSPNATINT